MGKLTARMAAEICMKGKELEWARDEGGACEDYDLLATMGGVKAFERVCDGIAERGGRESGEWFLMIPMVFDERELFEKAKGYDMPNVFMNTLSMGMSGDYRAAVAEGAARREQGGEQQGPTVGGRTVHETPP